jgi:hypothetical protein
MRTRTSDHDPGRRLEDEGVPDLQDGTPEQQWAEDPQRMPAPAEHPVGAVEYGTTVDEQVEGEPLDDRLARERPDTGADVDPLANVHVDEEVEPLDPSERVVGRLVEDDEGAHPDTEKDVVADDVGDGDALSAEEEAVHLSDEERVRLRRPED